MAVRRAALKSRSKRARSLRTELGEVVLHLRQVQSALVVAVAALRRQNCELDADVANLLQRSVVDRIEDQIGRLEATIRLAVAQRPRRA